MNVAAPDVLKKSPDASAIFSPCERYRYRLTRVIGFDARAACFVMLNPSTADHIDNDATIRRCITFAKREHCGELLVVNLFGFRATDPFELAGADDPVGPKNMDYVIGAACCAYESGGPVIAAWGAHGRHQDRDRYVMSILVDTLGMRLQCLGTTADGFPRHPCRLPNDAALEPYRERPFTRS